MSQPADLLTPAERATLHVVCETLLPSLVAASGDDPRLFSLSASTIGVPAAMEAAIGELDVALQTQFRQLLRALERPAVIAMLIGRWRPFSSIGHDDRERVMRAMATSRLPLLRTGFAACKRLAAFLFYALVDEKGINPTWSAIQYRPSSNPPAAPPALAVTTLTAAAELECDVCVIGSGAGGSVVSAEAAAAGKRAIVLEAGSGQQAPDFDQHEIRGMDLYLDHGMTATHDLGVAILAGGSLGGGTTVNWQTSLRTPPAIRDEWAALSGCRHFAEESFTRALDAVMARLRVSDGESVVNANNAKLRDGCTALGYRWSTIERNALGCDPDQCGYCVFGCRHGGRQSAATTYLCDAQRSGDTTIVSRCQAERVLLDGCRVTGVAAVTTDGPRHRVTVRAPVVVVAAGAIHSPAILLRSGLTAPAIGRNLYLHPTSAVAGTYGELIRPWRGPMQTILCDEFAWQDGTYGVRLETAPAHPGLLALATPWQSACQHRRDMQRAPHGSVIIALARDRMAGRVRLDRSGKPIVNYRPGRAERELLRAGIAAAVRIHLAAGAEDVLTLHTRELGQRPIAVRSAAAIDALCRQIARAAVDRNWSTLFSAHQMGTCRMGSDSRNAVCNGEGEVFGVGGLFIADASAFPASSGVNPMITIMALAHHTAQRVKMT